MLASFLYYRVYFTIILQYAAYCVNSPEEGRDGALFCISSLNFSGDISIIYIYLHMTMEDTCMSLYLNLGGRKFQMAGNRAAHGLTWNSKCLNCRLGNFKQMYIRKFCRSTRSFISQWSCI